MPDYSNYKTVVAQFVKDSLALGDWLLTTIIEQANPEEPSSATFATSTSDSGKATPSQLTTPLSTSPQSLPRMATPSIQPCASESWNPARHRHPDRCLCPSG